MLDKVTRRTLMFHHHSQGVGVLDDSNAPYKSGSQHSRLAEKSFDHVQLELERSNSSSSWTSLSTNDDIDAMRHGMFEQFRGLTWNARMAIRVGTGAVDIADNTHTRD